MNKVLVSFAVDMGRSGELTGLFVTTQSELKSLYGRYVYFGEVLGKHSDVSVTLAEEHFTVKSDEQDFVEKVMNIVADGGSTISGYNPFDYLDEEEEDEE